MAKLERTVAPLSKEKKDFDATADRILENANGVDEPLPGQMVFSDGVDIVSSSDLFISKRKELDGEGAALEPPVVELKALIMDT
ncbi:hypothetical protein QYF36_008922 [Acer negundo]|nr:hypothetical protein QYF36_008922 [Acer negundo]